jgi:mono/diheme cytochrome c family protein
MTSSSRLMTAFAVASIAVASAGCGDSSNGSFVEYRIVAASGDALTANVGDAFRLEVVEGLSDGTTRALSTEAAVTWSGPPTVTALPEGSEPSDSILPQPGSDPDAFWIQNPEHLTAAQVAGVLYVLDAGTAAKPSVTVSAAVTGGAAPAGSATASVAIASLPTGSVTRGSTLYAANCASCHGAQGEGNSAPGLNNEPDHVAGDSGWTPQMLGFAARSNMDDQGVSLAVSMPKWLVTNGAAGKLLTTQDFSDMYAFLQTQHGEGPAPAP